MADETMVLFDSPEAAVYRTDIKGWVSRDGRYFGDDERTARYSGCTHKKCECGQIFDKGYVRCRSCQGTEDMKRFYAMEMVEWDKTTPVCTFDDEKFFFSLEEVLDWLADQKQDDEVRLVLCEPGLLHTLDTDDWCDDLPEDGELPDDVAKALDAINEAIKNAGPVCWWPGNQRINLEPLWAKLKADKATNAGQ